MDKLCPCGSHQTYPQCCELIISGHREAATCQELMRSRYVAYTLAHVDYLMRSHHSRTRPVKERQPIRQWTQSVQWMGLVIINTQLGEVTDDTGYVEFRALFMEEGQMREIHEKSHFQRENMRWVYVSGIHF